MGSIEKTIQVFQILSETPYEKNLTNISKDLSCSPGNALHLLSKLEEACLVERDPATKNYILGPVFLRYSAIYGELKGINSIVWTHMKILTNTTKETTFFSVRDNLFSFLAYKEEGIHNDFFVPSVGRRLTIHADSSGKLLTAFLPQEKIKTLLASEVLEKKTLKTKIGESELMEEYENIRKQGYSIGDEEYADHLISFAAPIFDYNNRVNWSISIAGLKKRILEKPIEFWISTITNTANEISYKIKLKR